MVLKLQSQITLSLILVSSVNMYNFTTCMWLIHECPTCCYTCVSNHTLGMFRFIIIVPKDTDKIQGWTQELLYTS